MTNTAQGRFYVGQRGLRGHMPGGPTVPPDSLVVVAHPLQIQKLADHSDVISEVPKCSKTLIFRTPLGELTALP